MRSLFFRWKYYFDRGSEYWPIISFSMLATVLAKQLGLRATWFLPLAAGVLVCVISALGYVSVKWGRSPERMEREMLKRSPAWQLHLENNRMLKELTGRGR